MKQTTRILIGLAAGLVIGVLISTTKSPALLKIVPAIETAGAVWVNLLKMTVTPLVMSLLITGIASAGDPGKLGRIAGKALLVFSLLYLFVAVSTTLFSPLLFAWLTFTPDTIASLKESMGGGFVGSAGNTPSVGEQVVGIIPANPFKAAADGEILPLVIFSILFGLAVTRIAPETRQVLLRFFQGAATAMLVIVRWVLVVAPVGIFAVVLPLAARLGFAIVGALIYYIVLLSGLCVGFTLALYPVAVFFGGVPAWRFARASAPAQSVALGTQSSLASLPAMIEAAEVRLGLSPLVTGVVLPLAVSVFRFSTPIWLIVASFFVARLYDIELSPTQIATVGLMSVLMSVGGVGLPSGASYFAPITSVFLSVGLPTEAIPILFAVDTIPDMVETTTNVTANMTAATIVNHYADAAGLAPSTLAAEAADEGRVVVGSAGGNHGDPP
jgi:proton glutamate symport protein